MSLERWSYIAAVVGSAITLVGFPVLAAQVFLARRQREDAIRLSTTQVMLAADVVLSAYRDISVNLRPGGEWYGKKGKDHPNEDEMPSAEPYLGVFEQIFTAVDYGQVPIETVRAAYGYRVKNIWANNRIVEDKLQKDDLKVWSRHLIALTWVLESAGEEFDLHTDSYFPAEVFRDPDAARTNMDRARVFSPRTLRVASDIGAWIERTHHRRRRQQTLGRLTPVEYETIMTPSNTQAA